MAYFSHYKHFTVRYKMSDGSKQEACFYASDAWEARILAMEFYEHIRRWPNSIDLIHEVGCRFWWSSCQIFHLVKKWQGMATEWSTGSKLGFMTLTHCPLCIGLALLSAIRTTAHIVMIVQLERRTVDQFEHPASVLGTVFELWSWWEMNDSIAVSRHIVITSFWSKGGTGSRWLPTRPISLMHFRRTFEY